MIKSIKMKDCATYSHEGASILDCQKVNFLYGSNGSGKSTIGNYLNNLSDNNYRSCEIEWETSDPLDIYVYNRDFRSRNIMGDIAGVFTLGEATIDQLKQHEEKKKERERRKTERENSISFLESQIEIEKKHKEHFKDTVWNLIYNENKSDFMHVFDGVRNSKEKFRDRVIEKYNVSHDSGESKESLLKRYNDLFTKTPEKCDLIRFDIDVSVDIINSIETDQIWGKTIIGNKDIPISKLIEVLNNSDWVDKGRVYLQSDGTCPFCQQKTITPEIERQLNSFFSGEYEEDIKHIKELIRKYKDATDTLFRAIDSIELNKKALEIGDIDYTKLDFLRGSLKAAVLETMVLMEQKLSEVGRKITLSKSDSTVSKLRSIVFNANNSISAHNEMVEEIDKSKEKLTNDVWSFLLDCNEVTISGYLNDLSRIEKAKTGIQTKIKQINELISELDQEIVEMERNITSVQATVDEINGALKAYGFSNFKIVPSKLKSNFYQIQRLDGTLVSDTLSEGEETFISFLYFLQFSKGATDASKISSKKVLVLDDPICSLDSTVLYIVSSMVKALIKEVMKGNSDVAQVFVLTHNVFFHKEASFIDKRNDEYNDINYWIISKDNNVSSIRAYGKDNPIKTSYELLWNELKTNSNPSPVTTQNIMRRIIENYFSILGSGINNEIVDSFATVEDKMICRSLISWVNDGSHTIYDDLYIDSYTDSVTRYKEVFREIFIKMDHEAHYNMMMEKS